MCGAGLKKHTPHDHCNEGNIQHGWFQTAWKAIYQLASVVSVEKQIRKLIPVECVLSSLSNRTDMSKKRHLKAESLLFHFSG